MAGRFPVFAHYLLARMGWPVQRYARTPLPAGPRAERAGGWAFFLWCVAVGHVAIVRLPESGVIPALVDSRPLF